ncbi:DUF4190 domain-containing protein [Actinoplanes sp. KI2]|uniref:DUF4190 domain-containing protein n=1 Tax=Actinoplanes sp. KI2 TaxID=2983315 RepID=UPI0021D5DE08|nr:DUF4190 domain-containing protein [Actinoplanes sp. KI2]MCU7730937.1 DUF4190 domain-containing protein [Actinoplanes sp. KI2]
MTDQHPPTPGSVPPPDPTGNPAAPLPSHPQPPADHPAPQADPFAQQAYPPPQVDSFAQQAYLPPQVDSFAQQAYPPPQGDPYAQQAYPPPQGDPYAQQAYPPQQYGYPGYPPVDPTVNGFAIASLVCGILGCITISLVLAVVFGFVALNQIKTRGQRGRGLAIAGISLAGVWVVVTASVVVLAITLDDSRSASRTPADTVVPTVVASSTPTAEPTPTPTEESTTTDEFKPGQCMNDVTGARTIVSCKTPHDGEIFAIYDLKNGKWPGKETVKNQASAGCAARLTKYAKNPGRLDYYYGIPNQYDWPEDRSVTCVAVDEDDKKLTGSIHR